MAHFKDTFNYILKIEGGLSRSKIDKGGTTNFGISQRFLDRINYNVKAESLTREDAIYIYHTYFWLIAPFEKILSQKVANKIFDIGIHFAFEKAIELVQQSCNMFLPDGEKIKVDGAFGAKTLAAINKINPDVLINAIREKQIQRYQLIVLRDPTQEGNLKGWLNRAAK